MDTRYVYARGNFTRPIEGSHCPSQRICCRKAVELHPQAVAPAASMSSWSSCTANPCQAQCASALSRLSFVDTQTVAAEGKARAVLTMTWPDVFAKYIVAACRASVDNGHVLWQSYDRPVDVYIVERFRYRGQAWPS